jgi:hypothetical protein
MVLTGFSTSSHHPLLGFFNLHLLLKPINLYVDFQIALLGLILTI